MDVAKKFGMIQPGQSSTQAVRAVFVIDPEGKIRTILYYPLSRCCYTSRHQQTGDQGMMLLFQQPTLTEQQKKEWKIKEMTHTA